MEDKNYTKVQLKMSAEPNEFAVYRGHPRYGVFLCGEDSHGEFVEDKGHFYPRQLMLGYSIRVKNFNRANEGETLGYRFTLNSANKHAYKQASKKAERLSKEFNLPLENRVNLDFSLLPANCLDIIKSNGIKI